jgi:hypothetical protein
MNFSEVRASMRKRINHGLGEQRFTDNARGKWQYLSSLAILHFCHCQAGILCGFIPGQTRTRIGITGIDHPRWCCREPTQ